MYPRWHAHKKVVRELREHGKVKLYSEFPNEAEWKTEVFEYAMKGKLIWAAFKIRTNFYFTGHKFFAMPSSNQ